MREFAKRWLGDANAVELVPVTTDSAIQQLAAGAIDLVAAALIHKRDGDLEIDFSQTYFEDGQGLLVRANTDITRLAGLNGKVVAAIQGSPAKENLESYAASYGITINILPFQELTQALEALRAGQVDGLTAASAVLIQFAQENPELSVVEERFSSEPYGLGIPNYDDRFQDLVNFTLQEMKQDGTYDRLYTKWFNTGRPYNLRVEPGSIYLDFDLIPMLKVPTGEFKRGNPNGFPDERFEQTVFLNDYYIDQYEVTNRQYEGCVSAGQCKLPRLPRSVNFAQYYAGSDYGNFPVIWISWQDARNYCEFRGKRLPTEAEWEAAARGAQATLYPWGNQEPTTEANFNYSQRDVASVGSFPADVSGYGAFDMGGNVREWVADWYQWDYYLSAPAQNPVGPVAGVTKVLRGGSWNDIATYLRSTVRKNFLPDSFDGNLGFRCASSNFPPSR